MTRSYLDHNATTPCGPDVIAAISRALAIGGNPSSVHAEGRAARALMETARAQIATAVMGDRRNVILTGSGTEAAALALAPGFGRRKDVPDRKLIVSAGEHACVLSGGRFAASDVLVAPLQTDGIVALAELDDLMSRNPGALLALQLANNETGVIQPVAAAAAMARRHGVEVIVDGVQALGKMPVSLPDLGADAILLSAHKVGGPKGIGAIVLQDERLTVTPLVNGGGQEAGRRAGTENLAGIAGFAEAMNRLDAHLKTMVATKVLRDALEEGLGSLFPDAVVFGAGTSRLPNTSCFAIPAQRAEALLIALDLAGVAVSSGSACSSGKVRRSHVLAAMGVPDPLAECALRVSFGHGNTEDDVDRVLDCLARQRRQTGTRPLRMTRRDPGLEPDRRSPWLQ